MLIKGYVLRSRLSVTQVMNGIDSPHKLLEYSEWTGSSQDLL